MLPNEPDECWNQASRLYDICVEKQVKCSHLGQCVRIRSACGRRLVEREGVPDDLVRRIGRSDGVDGAELADSRDAQLCARSQHIVRERDVPGDVSDASSA